MLFLMTVTIYEEQKVKVTIQVTWLQPIFNEFKALTWNQMQEWRVINALSVIKSHALLEQKWKVA